MKPLISFGCVIFLILSALKIDRNSSQEVSLITSEKSLNGIFSGLKNIMNYEFYKKQYETITTKSTAVFEDQLKDIKDRIQALVKTKETLVNEIRKEAESAYLSHNKTLNDCQKNFVSYNRAKAINTTGEPVGAKTCQSATYFPLKEDPLMWKIHDNRENATAHVPTNVYDGSIDIQNVANWTSSLKTIFQKNAKEDPTQKWQYFGSTTGYFLIYPGIMWHILIEHALTQSTKVDFFDCRSQNWYLEASSSPRDIVIIVDRSGSMKGRRNIIANHTVYEILNTLTENDFFNIILFNDSIAYADRNINDRLVQATKKNKVWMIQQLSTQFHPMGIAMYQRGIEESFKLLAMARINSSATSNASQAIMIISDGAPENYQHIFDQYNPTKEVRVFTYLIGQAVTEDRPVKDMACNNKGYAVTISTLADVKENVQKYLDVVARISSVPPSRFTIWTGIHEDQMEPGIPQLESSSDLSNPFVIDYNATTMEPTSSTIFTPTTIYSSNVTQNSEQPKVRLLKQRKLFRMFVSIGQAVYNLKDNFPEDSTQISRLLGVAGLDVPISDFTRLARPWKLGVGAYIFMITNNGFLLFHPELRPAVGNRLKPYYQNVDIAEIIIPVNKSTEPPIYVKEVSVYNSLILREKMIKRESGVEILKVYSTTTSFTTAFEQNYKFYYDKIENTPYSLGLAVPQDLELKMPDFGQSSSSPIYDVKKEALSVFSAAMTQGCEFINTTSGSGTLLSPYLFCDFDSETTKSYTTEPICALREVLMMSQTKQTNLNCIGDYLKQVYEDAKLTKDAKQDWEENWKNYDEVRKKLNVSQAIALHYTGLIRFYNQEDPLYRNFINENRLGTQGYLYKETVFTTKLLKPDILVFTPKPNEIVLQLLAFNESVPTIVSTDVRVNEASFAVLAVQVDTEKLRLLVDESEACTNSTECLLVNSAGLIVSSGKIPSYVGLPLNAYDCSLMEDLVKNKVFESYLLYDFQGICTMTVSTISSFASRLFSPIASFMSGLMTFFLHLGTLISQFSLNSIWFSVKTYADEAVEFIRSFDSPSETMGLGVSNETLIEMQRADIDKATQKARNDLLTCVKGEVDQCVRKHITQNCIGINKNAQNCSIYCRVAFSLYPSLDMKDCKQPEAPCTKYYTAFRALPDFTNLSKTNMKYCTDTCIRQWSARYIEGTNLILLVIKKVNSSSCTCPCESQFIYYKYGIMLKNNGSGIIETSREKPPWHSDNMDNKPQNENSTVCTSGQMRLIHSSLSLLCHLLSSLTMMALLFQA